MRRTTLVAGAAASTLAATIGLVAPAARAVEPMPAAAAASPPLVYSTYVQTANGGNKDTIGSVRYDATVRTSLAATSLVVTSGPDSSSIAGTEVVGPDATYSPDHSRVAWTQSDWTPTTVSYSVKVLTRSTKVVKTFPLRSGSQVSQGGSYLAWFAGGSKLAMVLTKGSTSTVTTLDLGTGGYRSVYKLKPEVSVVSLAVSPDGTLAFSSSVGVAVLTPAAATPTYVYRSGTNESCTTVRVRPGSTNEFTYLCTKFSTTAGRQVLRSQTPSGPARTVYSADISSSPSVTFLDGFAWAPSGLSLALLTEHVRSVDQPSCTNALTSTLSTVDSDGANSTTLQTEPTITAQTCRGNGWGDVDTVAWSADGQTVAFLHATKFLGPMSAYAVRPDAPQTQTVLARNVIDLSS